MPRRSLRSPARSFSWKKLVLWLVGAGLVLLVLGFFIGTAWFNSFLRSERFRAMIARATSQALDAEAEFAPMNFSGSTVFAEGFQAAGRRDAFFSQLRVDQARADLNLRGLLDRAWRIDSVEVQRVQLALGGEKLPPAPGVESAPPPAAKARSSWLPDHVDLRRADVREMEVTWGIDPTALGSVKNTAVTLTPADNDGWDIAARGGTVAQAGWPSMALDSVRLRYRSPTIFVTSAELKSGDAGTLSASGEVNPESSADLQVQFSGIEIAPFLPADWKKKLTGRMKGDVRVFAPLPWRDEMEISGTAGLTDGQLTALPVLDKIAAFTRTQQFRTLKLTRCEGKFTHRGERTEVTDFVAESEGLVRMEGRFTIEGEQVEGTFEVGVTPASLQWLPGSRKRVFTTSRGGWLFTPMRVTGTLDSLSEDLSPRLIGAAADTLIEGVQDAVKDPRKAIETLLPFFQ